MQDTGQAAFNVLSETTLIHLVFSYLDGLPMTIRYLMDKHASNSNFDSQTKRMSDMEMAIQLGDLDALQLIYKLHKQKLWLDHPRLGFWKPMRLAAFNQRLEIMEWLRECEEGPQWLEDVFLLNSALESGDSDVLERLEDKFSGRVACVSPKSWEYSAVHGMMAAMKTIATQSNVVMTTNAMDGAAANGHLSMVEYLHKERTEGCSTAAIDNAAANGHMHVVNFLHTHRQEGCTVQAMDGAATKGHLDMIIFLHTHRTEGCTEAAMNGAATHGHLDIVRFLHEMRSEGCTEDAAIGAIHNAHIDVLEYLHDHGLCQGACCSAFLTPFRISSKHIPVIRSVCRHHHADLSAADVLTQADSDCLLDMIRMLDDHKVDGWTTAVMDHTASVGNLEAVEYLHLNRDEGCTTHAMDNAATNGHLDVVVFLHGHRSEGCTTEAMNGAAAHGALDVIRYLCQLRTEGCTSKAMEDAVLNHHNDVVDFLLGHDETLITSKAVTNAAEVGDLTLLIKFLMRSPAVDGGEMLCAAARGGHCRVVMYVLDLFAVGCHEIGVSLVEAAKNGCFMVVKLLLPRVSDADVISDAVEGAAGIGDVNIVALLLSVGKPFRPRIPSGTGEGLVRAAALGNVQLIELVENAWDSHGLRGYGREWDFDEATTWYTSVRRRQLLAAARSGHMEVLDSLWPKLHLSMRWYIIDMLGVAGNVDVFCYLHVYRCYPTKTATLMRVASFGRFSVLKFFYSRVYKRTGKILLLDVAAKGGSLDAVRFIHDAQCPQDECTTRAMDAAAARGFLDIIRYLHHYRTEGCTAAAMDQAASGHLTTLLFLHHYRREGCTSAAMDNAARVGALHIVRFLHEHRTEGCTVAAMDAAACNGHLHVVRYLHRHRSEGCSTRAMDDAARHGHFVVVKFLHEHRHEGCTTAAMDGASANGHLTIVQYLDRNRTEGCTTQALVDATRNGYWSVVKYLATHYDGRYAAMRGEDESDVGEVMDDTHVMLVT